MKKFNLSEGPAHTYVPLPRCLLVAAEGFGNICIQIAVILGFEVEADACLVPGVAQIVAVGGGYTVVAQAGVSTAAKSCSTEALAYTLPLSPSLLPSSKPKRPMVLLWLS